MCDRLAQEGVGRGIRTHDLLVTSSPTPPTWTPFRVHNMWVVHCYMGEKQGDEEIEPVDSFQKH